MRVGGVGVDVLQFEVVVRGEQYGFAPFGEIGGVAGAVGIGKVGEAG